MSNSSTYWTFRVTARVPRCPVRSSSPQPLVPPNYYRKTGDPRIAPTVMRSCGRVFLGGDGGI